MIDLSVQSHGITDRGRVRSHNEDQFLIAALTRVMTVSQTSLSQPSALLGDHRGHLFVVADGIGGHKGGEQASALAVATIEQFMLNTLKWFFSLQGANILAEFKRALRRADARIFDAAAEHPELQGMGTTLTMAYAVDGALYVVHAGDSRCYLFRQGRLHQLTHDHTVTSEMVREGALTLSEAATSPFRNVLTNAVGGRDVGVHAEVQKLELADGDVALLCSDGLSDMLVDGDIAAILAAAPSPADACARFVADANAAGGRDNITAIVARFAGDAVATARAPETATAASIAPELQVTGSG